MKRLARFGILSSLALLAGCPSSYGPVGADSGPGVDASVTVDAGSDAGSCAPRQPTDGTGCHVSSECNAAAFEMCFAPGASRGCGICAMAHRTCATDADCASTDFCEEYLEPCAMPNLCGNGSDVHSTRCTPRCTASSCAAGSSCGTDGRCTPDACTGGGYTCPTHTHCAAAPGEDGHGCVRDTCALDSDCGCGAACLSGRCFDTLGTCTPPAA